MKLQKRILWRKKLLELVIAALDHLFTLMMTERILLWMSFSAMRDRERGVMDTCLYKDVLDILNTLCQFLVK